jgi:hypothetical protein
MEQQHSGSKRIQSILHFHSGNSSERANSDEYCHKKDVEHRPFATQRQPMQ